MDIVEFAEKFAGMELTDFQKKFLTEMYNAYEKDPDSFNKFTYPCQRGSAIFDVRPILAVIFSLFDKEVENDSNDKRRSN